MTLIPSFHVLCMRGSSIRLQNSPAMSSPTICSNHRLLNCIRFIVPLSVIANESDSIQAELYEASRRLVKRQTGVLYYDCTNYFLKRNVRKA